VKKNRYKKDTEKAVSSLSISKPVIMIIILCLTSLALIYVYDFTMQSTYFNIKKIQINGNNRINNNEIIDLAQINKNDNILSLNLSLLKKRIVHHPWIQSAAIQRALPSRLTIDVNEETPLAIVKFENIADILINSQGKPFKEFDSVTDNLSDIPIITGLELHETKQNFIFKGSLFSSVLEVLAMNDFGKIRQIRADKNMGIVIQTSIANNKMQIKLGFNQFLIKALKAKQITNYFNNHIVNKEICTFDLYDPENVLVKSKDKDALHNLTKGGA